jgi:thiol-disulfide isomerase/thioredoxin|tara:strand:- start:4830 stop:5306 length:477 start_codon:yes stop_codon:yes gene_type:complete
MANIIDVIGKYIQPYKKIMIIVFILIAFYYAIRYWMNINNLEYMENKFDDVANSNLREKEAIIYFFHVDWCPHCKTALPEWNAFKTANDNKLIKNYRIKCEDVDCTDESDSKVSSLVNRFNIESYPTVKMVRDDKEIDFDSKVTQTTLTSFTKMMLDN